jgi:hypothetical protein
LPKTNTPNPVAGLDGYELRHLAAHLIEGGDITNLRRLLALEFGTNRENAWYAAHQAIGEATGYRADIARARQASRTWATPADLGFDLRYALIDASVDRVHGQLPVAMLLALVNRGVWTRSEAVSRAQALNFPERAQAIVAMTNTTRDDVLLESEFEAARAESDEDRRTTAVLALVPHLRESLRSSTVDEILDRLKSTSSDAHRVSRLRAVAESLTEPMALRALEIARATALPLERAEAIVAVLPALPEDTHAEVWGEVWDAWECFEAEHPDLDTAIPGRDRYRDIDASIRGAVALAQLAPYVNEDTQNRLQYIAWATATKAAASWMREQTPLGMSCHHPLIKVVPHLAEPYRSKAQRQLVTDCLARTYRRTKVESLALAIEVIAEPARPLIAELIVKKLRWLRLPPAPRAEVLGPAIPYLPEPTRTKHLERALTDALSGSAYAPGMQNNLARVAPHLPTDKLLHALNAAWRIEDEHECTTALMALIPFLPEDDREQTFQEATNIVQRITVYEPMRISALIAASQRAQPPWRKRMLALAIRSAGKMSIWEERAEARVELAAHAEERQRARLLRQARSATRWRFNRWERISVLAMLAHELPEPARTKLADNALATAVKIRDEKLRGSALVKLAPVISHRLQIDLLRAVMQLTNPSTRRSTLRELLPYLRAAQCAEAVRYLLDSREEMATQWEVVSVLDDIAKLGAELPAEVLDDVLDAVIAINGIADRAAAFAPLADRCPESLRARLLNEILCECADKPLGDRLNMLAPLLPCLPESARLDLAVEAVRCTTELKTDVIAKVGPHAPASMLVEADADVVQAFAPFSVNALAVVAPGLTDEQLADAVDHVAEQLAEAVDGFDDDQAHDAQLWLAHWLKDHTHALPQAALIRLVRAILDTRTDRAALLQAITILAPLLFELSDEHSMSEVAAGIIDASRWWP